ncbi:MAG: hypothetical protein Q4E74_00500 [Ruminococcus sp.]|nr:hypothetical protein [Ruminococcus sp.]
MQLKLQGKRIYLSVDLFRITTIANKSDKFTLWDDRHKSGEVEGTQHDSGHFDIALELADYISKK